MGVGFNEGHMHHFSSGLNCSKTSKIPNIMGGRVYEAVHNPHRLSALRSYRESKITWTKALAEKFSNQLVL